MPRFLSAQLNYLVRETMLDNDAGVSAFPDEAGGLLKWLCSVEGPKDTPWEGRLIRCTLNFCPEVAGGVYPERAPQLLVLLECLDRRADHFRGAARVARPHQLLQWRSAPLDSAQAALQGTLLP